MTQKLSQRLHASCVVMAGRGVLIVGASGCGKTSLAAELISRGAQLLADDVVQLECVDQQLYARAPSGVQPAIELYGVGVMSVDAYAGAVPVALVLRCMREPMERMPEPKSVGYLACTLPCWEVNVLDAGVFGRIWLACRAFLAGEAVHCLSFMDRA